MNKETTELIEKIDELFNEYSTEDIQAEKLKVALIELVDNFSS